MLESVLIVVLVFVLAIISYEVYKVYFSWCSKSPCSMIRESGKCPFEGMRSCIDCPYFDKDEEKNNEN